jgi:hypothetical protein
MSYPKDAEVSLKFKQFEQDLRLYFKGYVTIQTVYNGLREIHAMVGLSEINKWKESVPSIPSSITSDPTEKMNITKFLAELVAYDKQISKKDKKWKHLMKPRKR